MLGFLFQICIGNELIYAYQKVVIQINTPLSTLSFKSVLTNESPTPG